MTVCYYERYNEVFGAVAWPGQREGCAVVASMKQPRRFETHTIELIDEYESFDLRDLVQHCCTLDTRHRPTAWVGDSRNNAAYSFIQQANIETFGRRFSLSSTRVLNIEPLYPFILAEIKRLLDPERRQLFLKDSRIINYLNAIDPSEVSSLMIGDYPAIEALGFVVVAMRDHVERENMDYDPANKGVEDLLSID